MKILAFDSSNQTLSVAIMEDDMLLAESVLNIKSNHSLTLMPEIDRLMQVIGWQPEDLDRIVVSEGPGSYTGVRIAVTTAKTLAYTLNIDLVGVSSLEVLAQSCTTFDGMILPLFDARRQNVYASIFTSNQSMIENLSEDRHISLKDLLIHVKNSFERVLFIGDAWKFKDEILREIPNAMVSEESFANLPHASNLARIGRVREPVKDVHTFIPKYLKRVEAEEKWLESQKGNKESEDYVEKI